MSNDIPSEIQLIQDAANMGVLARQAIANGFPTMEVDPKICANVALLVERLMQTPEDAPIPVDEIPEIEDVPETVEALTTDEIPETEEVPMRDEDPVTGPASSVAGASSLSKAKEEGRREAIGSFAQERADLLQQISELEASVRAEPCAEVVEDTPGQAQFPEEAPPQAVAESKSVDDFKGPGQ